MDLRFETPSTQQQYEQWVAILNEVSGDVFDVDEIQHFIESDDESAWLLALCRRRGPRLRRGTAVVDPEQPLRNGARPAGAPCTGSRDADLRGVVAARPLVGARVAVGPCPRGRHGIARFRPQPRLPRGRPRVRGGARHGARGHVGVGDRRNRARLARRSARPRAGRLRGGLRGRRETSRGPKATTSRASLSPAGASSTSRALERSPTR